MDYQQEIEKIEKWMKDYADKAGSQGFVVGLSGGIDSSVIACLAVKAVGKDNVVGISLPCQTRQDMKDDASELSENLNIRFLTISLEKAFNAIDIEVSDALYPFPEEKFTNTLSKANTKARLRMTALYEVANEMNYLVAGTGNKSELMIGYFTKGGDGQVDMEPLGNYYKTEVYKMAELMLEIPEGPKTKAPSADLYEGQTDEQELGMSYDELNKYLSIYEANNGHWNDVYLDDDLTEDQFNKVKAMVERSIHKNETPPKYER